jgi:protein-tyrosine phosphatase
VIDADYGNLDAYFSDGLGLGTRERAKLEAIYLEA